MKTFYRRHEIQVTNSNSAVVYDIYRAGNHLLAGYDFQNTDPRAALVRMKSRVDHMIAEESK